MGKLRSLLIKASHYILNKEEDRNLKSIIDIVNFEKIDNERISFQKKIVFVIPKMVKFSGGLTSILRIGTRLSQNGYQVLYASYNCDNTQEMSENASHNLKNFEGVFVKFSEVSSSEFDFVIATNWQSVYFAKKLKGYKIVFVQDFEPYFYSVGENYFLSKKTYEFGFHLISLGNWNITQVKNLCSIENVKMDYVDFPFESSEYTFVPRDYNLYKDKKTINLAVYIKRDTKRLPSLIINMLDKAYYSFKEKGITLNIKYFGLNPKEKISIGKNLGRLSKKELNELYKKSDFGMVASMTNISLVPYEMIGTGLPVIEFKDGSYECFLGKDSSLLIDFDYNELIEKMIALSNNPDKIKAMTEMAFNKIKDLSWEKTASQFVEILNTMK